MKIVTWNINGYRSVTGQNTSKRFDKITKENKLFAYIDATQPDLIAMQETKAEPEQILSELRCPQGYHAEYNWSKARKGYSGVATFSKQQPKQTLAEIGIEKFDVEGRILASVFDNFVHFNVYFPNGTSGDERVAYKLEFYDALFAFIKREFGDLPAIVSGDYNTAHCAIDLARPKENEGNSGFLPIEREKFDEILALGYIDSFRELHSEANQYTWWSNRGRARENNVGWRLDYHLVDQRLQQEIRDCTIEADVLGSDHCPLSLNIF